MEAIQELETRDLLMGLDSSQTHKFYDALREAVRQDADPARGYWQKRLALALKVSHQDLYYIATLYAHLGDKTNAYAYLKNACERKAFDQGLLFDLCWDHSDPQFRAIARDIGLLNDEIVQ